MRHLNKFSNESGYNQHTSGDGYLYPDISYVVSGTTVHYTDYEKMPLTFQIIGEPNWTEGNTYEILLYNDSSKKIQVRVNGGKWVEYPFSDGAETEKSTITGLTPGDLVQFKSDVQQTYSFEGSSSFRCNTKFSVFGNLNSLNAYSNTLDDYNYCYLFEGTNVVSAKNLILSAIELASDCYACMFDGCTSLTSAPELPATTLADSCYYNMFYNCTSLTSAPELPATILTNNCYGGMFSNCTSLTTAPELPATTLANYCYNSMFRGCTSLIQAPALPATTLAWYCYQYMFYSCISLTTAPELPATALSQSCYANMFQGCTSLTKAPELPATALKPYCYEYMFSGCTSLAKITCMATSFSGPDDTRGWVNGVANSGTFIYNPSIYQGLDQVWEINSINGIPIGWAVTPYQYFNGNGTLAMWVDDYPDPYNSDWMNEKYSYDGTFDEYLADFMETDFSGLENTFKYIEPFVYNDRTYYLWYDELQWGGNEQGLYILTETNDYDTLYEMSMESDITNRICPFFAIMSNDSEISYIKQGNDLGHVLVKVWRSNGELYLYVDDFPSFYTQATVNVDGICTETIEDYLKLELKRPNGYYANMYEYTGEEIEYDGEEYFIWVYVSQLNQKQYLLTDTINLKELKALSIESDLNNRNHPVQYLGSDLNVNPDYEIDHSSDIDDVILKVVDLRQEKQNKPLTFKILSGGTICWQASNASYTRVIEYSLNGGDWVSLRSTKSGNSFSVSTGDVVKIRGYNADIGIADENSYYNTFSGTTASFNIEGNVMSLFYGDDLAHVDYMAKPYNRDNFRIRMLFTHCKNLIDASNLILLQTTLTSKYYHNMFHGCTNLTTAPELPATTLADSCYGSMFYGCAGLTSAPALPATELASSCYSNMFYGCTGLTTAPVLPATTLKNNCYRSMFEGCTSLISAPELPATTLANYCYAGMFRDCTSLTSAPVLPATTLAQNCYSNMFEACTSLISAPELPATTLVSNCYSYMFNNCTSLTLAPSVLPATTLAVFCYYYMFNGCTSLTTAPELPATTLTNNCYRYMFQNCTNLNYIKAMFTTTPSTTYTQNWVSGVAANGTFVKNSAAQWNVRGVHGIPNNWTVETASE